MRKILVVDDDIFITELIGTVLEDDGHCVVTAPNGMEALERLSNEGRVALVLTDVMMPLMDGQEFCRRLCADERFRDSPVVPMSAATTTVKRDECPYRAFLVKPFDLDQLIDTVRGLTKRAPDDHPDMERSASNTAR